MYSLDGNVSFGDVTEKAVGSLEIYDDGTVLATASYFSTETGYLKSPKIHSFRGKEIDRGPDSMVIENCDGKIRLSGIDFTHNTPYEDIMTAKKSRSRVGIRDDVN